MLLTIVSVQILKIELQYTPFNLLHLLSLKIVSVLIVLVATLLYFNHTIELPMLIMMAIFSFVIFDSVEHINNAAHVLEIIDVTLDDIAEIKTAPELNETATNQNITNYNIAFDHVSFAYEQQSVIKDVTFNIDAQTSTAIIGPSGSGKSTLCHLLLRFYDVDEGSIRIGDVDIRVMTLSTLMSHISAVFQKFTCLMILSKTIFYLGNLMRHKKKWLKQRNRPVVMILSCLYLKAIKPLSTKRK